MSENFEGKKEFRFSGLKVYVPQMYEVKVSLDSYPPSESYELPEGFELIREIGNIVIRDNNGEIVDYFEEPIELEIEYNQEDLWKADGNFNNLKLAYYDLKNWVILKENKYRILPPREGHKAIVVISSFADDPTIIWGK